MRANTLSVSTDVAIQSNLRLPHTIRATLTADWRRIPFPFLLSSCVASCAASPASFLRLGSIQRAGEEANVLWSLIEAGDESGLGGEDPCDWKSTAAVLIGSPGEELAFIRHTTFRREHREKSV